MVKIIIVEPDEPQRARWASVLEARGFDVDACATVTPAEDAALAELPHVLVLGPGAGGGDPAGVLRALQDAPAESRATVCIVAPNDIESAAELGRANVEVVLPADIGPGGLATVVRCLADRAEGVSVANEVGELRSRYAELESLVYLISHDLKTPLVSIQGIATILLEGGASEERTTEYIRRVQANAERIEDLMRDLLEFPKVGRLVGEPEPIEMGDVVERALEALAQTIEESNATVDVEGELPAVMGDRKRLQQVLHNLVDNAIKYGGDEARVRIGHNTRSGEEAFFVQDFGVGISPGDLEKAFHLFRRLDDGKRNRNGMGIGLAVSRKIIEGHGGRIWVDSEVGKGSTFWFSLPRARRNRPTNRPSPDSRSTTGNGTTGPSDPPS